MSEQPVKFKGTAPCGCVVLLYSGSHDTLRQRKRAIAEAIRDGLTLTPLFTERECRQANAEWGSCPHQHPTCTWAEAERRAEQLLGVGA